MTCTSIHVSKVASISRPGQTLPLYSSMPCGWPSLNQHDAGLDDAGLDLTNLGPAYIVIMMNGTALFISMFFVFCIYSSVQF
jgi:hypothetical protein